MAYIKIYKSIKVRWFHLADEKVIDLDRLSRFHDNLKSNGLPLNNWQANKKYKVGYTVIQDGKFYRCKTEQNLT